MEKSGTPQKIEKAEKVANTIPGCQSCQARKRVFAGDSSITEKALEAVKPAKK
jgi:hypothetical protein